MRVEVLVEGMVGGRFVKERLSLDAPEGASLRDLAHQIRRRAGVDLFALAGSGVVAMLDGERLDLPVDAERIVPAGALLAVLSPLAGGCRSG